jgi:hypothetical protein
MFPFSNSSALLSAIIVLAGSCFATEEISKDLTTEFKEKIEPLLQDYCYDCHGDGADKGDFVLDEY